MMNFFDWNALILDYYLYAFYFKFYNFIEFAPIIMSTTSMIEFFQSYFNLICLKNTYQYLSTLWINYSKNIFYVIFFALLENMVLWDFLLINNGLSFFFFKTFFSFFCVDLCHTQFSSFIFIIIFSHLMHFEVYSSIFHISTLLSYCINVLAFCPLENYIPLQNKI